MGPGTTTLDESTASGVIADPHCNTPSEDPTEIRQSGLNGSSKDHDQAPGLGDPQAEEVEFQYLTWETECATRPFFNSGTEPMSPAMPNLAKYDNPFHWPMARKAWMTWLACSVNGLAAYASGAYASPAAQLQQVWHISYVAYNVGITTFTVGFAVAPMFLAPFSEINGRRPVFLVTGIMFVVCQMWCALANNYASMLLARLFLGIAGSSFSTISGGLLADIFVTKDRNTPMVLFTGATLLGTGFGPLVSGFIAQRLLWRWVFYVQIMTSGVLIGLVVISFRETRGSVLLSQKAAALNKWYEQLETAGALGMVVTPGDEDTEKDSTHGEQQSKYVRLRYKVKADEERASLLKMLSISLYRPFQMLVTEPVIFWFSLWLSFAWAVLYLQFGSIPLVFETNHGFSLEQTGLVFISMCIGAVIITTLSIYQEPWADRKFPGKISGTPEGRLYFTCVQSAFLPIGIFWFAWTCYGSIHWIVPTISIAFITMGIFSIFLAVFNYSADVYKMYASSAIAGVGLCRNLLGGSFPLVTHQMFNNLGFQAAGSLLGGISLFLTMVPWVLVFYGPSIRRRSRIARNFVDEDKHGGTGG